MHIFLFVVVYPNHIYIYYYSSFNIQGLTILPENPVCPLVQTHWNMGKRQLKGVSIPGGKKLSKYKNNSIL